MQRCRNSELTTINYRALGTHLSGRRAGRVSHRTAWPQQQRPSAKAVAEAGGRRSASRSAETACGERLPKKLASLGFGRRAMPAQKTQVVQKLRQRHSLDILLSIAQLPRATFYYHLKRMNSSDKYKAVKAEITAIYHENKGKIRLSPHYNRTSQAQFSPESQDCPAAYEGAGFSLPCQEEEVSFLQG